MDVDLGLAGTALLPMMALFALVHFTLAATLQPSKARRYVDLASGRGGTSSVAVARAYLLAAAACAGAIIYNGIDSMFFWVPSSWGWVGEDGWQSGRSFLATALTVPTLVVLVHLVCGHLDKRVGVPTDGSS